MNQYIATQDFINAAKSLITNKIYTRKMGWKSNENVHFSKQMLLFHIFLLFILRYVKK